MTSLTLYSAFDRIAYGESGSIKKSVVGRYSKRCLRTRVRHGQKPSRYTDRGKLLEQLEVCCEELNVAIMAELDERERINQELREEVHQQLDIARGLIYGPGGSEAHKALFTKFDNLVSDRSKRLKSDNLRKLLEHIKNLQIKAEINQSKNYEQPTVEPVTSTTSTTAPTSCAPTVSSTKVAPPPQEISKVSEPAERTPPVPTVLSPVKEVIVVGTSVPDTQNDKPAEEMSRPPREIISEQAKQRQKAQIPWRPPRRLEPFRIPKKSGSEIKKDAQEKPQKKTPVADTIEPLPLKEPERLALRYKPKVRKRHAEESPSADTQFKKPFPMSEPEPLFQRRHQLAPPVSGPVPPGPKASSRDPRNYGDYCNRRMTLMQNRARFERQNQQYFPPQRHQHEQSAPVRPMAAAHPFAVPAPVLPAPQAIGAQRPPAPKASVAPTVTRPVAPPVPAAPVPAVVRPDNRKTNPVYSNDEPIRLGKKDAQKKDVSSTKLADEAVPEQPKPVEDTAIEKKASKESAEKEKSATESKKATQKEKDNALQKNLLDMLKELGDEKAKQILDVMGKKSDDESEKPKEQQQEEQPKRAKAGEKKTGKKFKRIRSKQDVTSDSDEEGSKKEQQKKEKGKPAKRVSGGSREVSALIENSSDWMSKGSIENHYTRRRATAVQLLVSPPKQEEQNASSKKDSSSSDEEGLVSSKQQEEDSLLTVAKVVPAVTTKGKQKAKETNFVYNDKKTVHCNSNYSSNCSLCSFNGSAIVDHYVYDHKTYEVFVSRVSPKMADIIRSDLFMTNGTLVTDDNQEEKIRFKCYFCLAPKELRRAEWTDHLSSHTGEYRYRCTSCPVMSRTEELGSAFFHEKSCLKPTLAVYNNIEFEENHLYGFICDACNFIQIRRVNMERHLKREHPSSDVTCSRFSILNYKVETKPIIDEEQMMMAEMASSSAPPPTVMLPFTAKAEPLDTYEIVNQPFTEDEEMPELPAVSQLPRRTDIRLESVHIGQVGATLPNQLAQLPFLIKMEPELQREAISSNCYESPMSPEPAPMAGEQSEAQAAIPVLQIQCVSGGVDWGNFSVKREKPDDGFDSDGSDTTVDLNMSGEGRQCATDTNQQNKGGASPTSGESSGSASAGNNAASGSGTSSGSAAAGGGAAGAGGGDDGDDRKKEESFPVPIKIKVEKDEQAEEEEKKKKLLQGVTDAMGNVKVKTENLDDDPLPAEGQFDFAELVLDSKRMQHVAYVEQDSEALFLCIIPTCNYITKVADDIGRHIARKHNRVIWDGYCQTCRSQITPSDCSINDELQHLLTIHARKKTPPLEMLNAPAPVVSNVIRIRKMPGDTLSMGDLNPPPLMPILQSAITAPPSQVIVNLPTVPNFTNSTTVQAFPSPMIIQSAATISTVPTQIGMNQLFTPTHTIPAQIRPIPATIGSSITVAPAGMTSPPTQAGHSALGSITPVVPIRTVHLKPWTNMVTTKNQEHCRSMLEEISLLCLFKCMSRACAFSTNKRLFMAQHLALHDQMHQKGPNSLRKCWLECAYCDLIAPNSSDLLVHVDTEHGNCGFQCNLCFYRSRDPTNVVVHQKEHHPHAEIARKILIMPDNLKSFGDDEWRAMQDSLRKHVIPLHCTTTQ